MRKSSTKPLMNLPISALSPVRWAPAILCAIVMSTLLPAQADWMLIANSGEKSDRACLFVDIESLRESVPLTTWHRIIDADPGHRRQEVLATVRPDQNLDAVEILESSAGPESRTYSLSIGAESRYEIRDAVEWSHDGSRRVIPDGPWSPPDPGWKERSLKFVSDQKGWKTALLALLKRTQKEKNVTTQTELEKFGYQYLQGNDSSALSDIIWQYVWTDGQRPESSPSLAQSKQQFALTSSETSRSSPGSRKLSGNAFYFNDSLRQDRGYTVAPVDTTVYLYPLNQGMLVPLLSQYRAGAAPLEVSLSPELLKLRRQTTVVDQEGHFSFEGLQPGLYVLECRVPYRYLASSDIVDEVVENRIVYSDGSYDVESEDVFSHTEYEWAMAPGNWTIDVVEISPDDDLIGVELCNIRK